jgi:hypothetical protein
MVLAVRHHAGQAPGAGRDHDRSARIARGRLRVDGDGGEDEQPGRRAFHWMCLTRNTCVVDGPSRT